MMFGIIAEKTKHKPQERSQVNVLDSVKLFRKNGGYNIVHLKAHLMDEGVIRFQDMDQLIDKFIKCIEKQPNMHQIQGSVIIIGDIHGQYYDFLKILSLVPELDKDQNKTKLLFLGDYVDRGANSIQVITLIMALKINYPKKVFLLRGNHQSRCMTGLYNFMTQTFSKYNQSIYEKFMIAFDHLPLACLINKRFFCVHGGITEKLLNIKKINTLDRFLQIPLEGPFCDFIWSDPINNDYGSLGCQTKFNESRQCSIYFGKMLTQKFFAQNDVISIIRAHEVFPQGFNKCNWKSRTKTEDFPDVITVFSAPNYCGVYGNKGAIIKLQNDSFQIRQYKQESVNNKLYDYLQVFRWSVPEVVRVINQFSLSMISSLYEIHLKKDFPNLWKESDEVKLNLLLDYINGRKDIKNSKPLKHSQTFTQRNQKTEKKEKESEKERLFNRSIDYFHKEHQRPKSGEYNGIIKTKAYQSNMTKKVEQKNDES